MRTVIAILLILVGAGGGIALGVLLKPDPGAEVGHEAVGEDHGDTAAAGEHGAAEGDGHGGEAVAADGEHGDDSGYVDIGRQLIIPIVEGGETRALMLFQLALDVPAAMTEKAYSVEPRLRDAFMRELFQMSYTGAFSASYTDERVVQELRLKLRAAARAILGNEVREVLILDIMRQEM